MKAPETKYEMKRRMERELIEIAAERAKIEEEQQVTSVLSKEFDLLCEKDKALSIRQFSHRFKLRNIENGKPLLGQGVPQNNVIDNTGFKPVN